MVLKLGDRAMSGYVFATVVSSFDGSDTEFEVETGEGARFPTVPYALVLYDTRFGNPAEAYWQGEAETVLVTGRTSDTLTVVRGIEGTTPFSAVAGHRYRLLFDATVGYLDMLQRLLNVRTYGAVGDGSTDDTQAFLDALGDIAETGGVIFVPRAPSAYRLDFCNGATDVFRLLSSHVAIIGEPGAKVKGTDGADAASQLIRIWGDSDEDPLEDILIQGLELDGNASEGSLGSGSQAHLIDIAHARRVTIDRCYLHDSLGDGVKLDYNDADAETLEDITIERCRIDTVYRNGISVVKGERYNILHNRITNFNTIGIDAEANDEDHLLRDGLIQGNFVSPSPTLFNAFNSDRASCIQVRSPNASDTVCQCRVIQNACVGLEDDDDPGNFRPLFGINIHEFRGAIVEGNQVTYCRQGISSAGDPGASNGRYNGSTGCITANHVRFCKGATSGLGIQVLANMLVQANVSEYNDGPGIRASGRGCSVIGNTCRNNGNVAGATQPWGILIEGSEMQVIANDCTDVHENFEVTLTKSGTTITVDHTAHGFTTGDFIRLYNLDDATYGFNEADAGSHEITVVDVNTYTYELDVEPTNASATGRAGKPTQQYGIYIDDSAVDNTIAENDVRRNGQIGGIRNPTPFGDNDVRANKGYITEMRGISEIPTGSTSVVVPHLCHRTPVDRDIFITGRGVVSNNPGNIWITDVDDTTFTVNCRTDPGASGFDFGWNIVQRPFRYRSD